MALDHLAEVMGVIWPMSCLRLLSVRKMESTRDQSPAFGTDLSPALSQVLNSL